MLDFASKLQLQLRPFPVLDGTMCEYVDFRFLDGEGSEHGEKLRASLMAMCPEWVGHQMCHVPRFMRSLRGWKRAAPGQSRTAIPESVCYAIAGVLLRRGHKEMSLFNRALFSTYLRPSALLGIMTLDVLDPPPVVAQMSLHPAIIVSPEEREARTKTGHFDLTVVLDDVRDLKLGVELCALRDARLRSRGLTTGSDPGDLPLFSFKAREFGEAWSAAVAHLGVGETCTTPYQNRHGGPSRDIQLRLRDLLEVQKRGHWKAAVSLRNYEKAGRLHKIVAKIPEWVMRYGEEVRLYFADAGPQSSQPPP